MLNSFSAPSLTLSLPNTHPHPHEHTHIHFIPFTYLILQFTYTFSHFLYPPLSQTYTHPQIFSFTQTCPHEHIMWHAPPRLCVGVMYSHIQLFRNGVRVCVCVCVCVLPLRKNNLFNFFQSF